MKYSNILISIIVPVYNSEKYLDKCIGSIIKQNYSLFELLLINDGSIDSSEKICESYVQKDSRIKLVNKKNGGVSSARNMGITLATGEYVCFVDSDDWIDEGMLTAYVSSINQTKSDLIFQGLIMSYPGLLKIYKIHEAYYSGHDVQEAVLLLEEKKMLGWVCNKVFRLDKIISNKIFFDESISMQEDHIFTLQYIQYIDSIAIIDQALYYYRISNTSLAHRRISYFELKKKNELLYKFRKKIYDNDLADVKYLQDTSNALLRMYEKDVKVIYRDRIVEIRHYKEILVANLLLSSIFFKKILVVIVEIFPIILIDLLLSILLKIKLLILIILKR